MKITFWLEKKSFPGHKGRPGQRGGSLPRSGGGSSIASETIGKPKKPKEDWRTEPRTYGRSGGRNQQVDSVLNYMIKDGTVDHRAIVMNAGAKSLKDAQEEYNHDGNTKFFLVRVKDKGRYNRETGHFEVPDKLVRLMGYFGASPSPKPGDKIAIAKDDGNAVYTMYMGDVVPDDGKRYSLWHYD